VEDQPVSHGQFGYFVDRLRATPEGDGTLLGHSIQLYGAGITDTHVHPNLPLLVVTGDSTVIKGGRYVRYAKGTPVMNLHLSLLDKVGVPVEKLLGDSTGRLEGLSGI
jgi:hypothetical protein